MPLLTNPLKGSILKRHPQGSIMQGYGENAPLYKQAVNLAFHNGIDLFMPQPCDVVSATDGIVVVVKNDPSGYGKAVYILSPKLSDGYYYQTIYGHLDEISVVFGQQISAGEKIGVEGNTGFVISGGTPYWGNAPGNKGVHLHFGAVRLTDDLSVEGLKVDILVGKEIKKFVLLNYNNGVKGATDPLPLLIDEETPMLEKYKGKLVRNTSTGQFGLCLGSEILTVGGEDRTALLALDTLVRAGFGVNIPPQEFDSIPHRPF